MIDRRSGVLTFVAVAVLCGQAWSQPPTILTPGPEAYTDNRFDRSDELQITGDVEKVEAIDSGTIVWLRAKSVEPHGFGPKPGTAQKKGAGFLWRVEGAGLAKLKDSSKLVPGAKLVVIGNNAIDKKCEPTCRISSDKVTLK